LKFEYATLFFVEKPFCFEFVQASPNLWTTHKGELHPHMGEVSKLFSKIAKKGRKNNTR